ncbi:MAG: protein kinase [Candidatus Altimarinota bacterium]
MAQSKAPTAEVFHGLQNIETSSRGRKGYEPLQGVTNRIFAGGKFTPNGATVDDIEILKAVSQSKQNREGFEWLHALVSTLVDTRYRAETVLSQSASGERKRADFTLNDMAGDERTAGVRLLQEHILPFLQKNQQDPMLFQKLVNGLNVCPVDPAGSLFMNISADGQALPPPLHVVGRAMLQPIIQKRITEWSRSQRFKNDEARLKWLRDRFSQLEESVRFTEEVEQIKNTSEQFLNWFTTAAETQGASAFSQAELHLQKFYGDEKIGHEVISVLSKKLNKRSLSPAERALADKMVEHYLGKIEKGEVLLRDMCVALDALDAQLRRQDKRSKRMAQPKAQKASKPAPVRGTVPDRELRPLEGDQAAAATALARMMRADAEGFSRLLRSSIGKQAHSLAIDVPKSSFRVIGSGGTCVVVEVFSSMMGKPIALRCDIMGLTNQEDAELAIRSFAVHSKLSHPNIVQDLGFASVTLDVPVKKGSRQMNVPVSMTFQRLELLENAIGLEKTIRGYSALGTVPNAKSLLEFLHQLFATLDYIHRSEVVHRDIKEENLMLLPPKNWDGADLNTLLREGTLKFLDLGVARDNSQGQESPLTLAKDDEIFGTLPYLAPEALIFSKNTRNPSADIYQLGVFLYFLITGQKGTHPYEASRNADVRWNDPFAVVTSVGQLSTDASEEPSVVSLEDSLIESFIDQNNPHNIDAEETLAYKIAQLVSLMCEPDPTKRPNTDQLLDFLEDPASFQPGVSAVKKGSKAPKKKGKRSAMSGTRPGNSGAWGFLKRLFGGA